MDNIKLEDLLESPIFQCIQCKKRLSPPIMNVQDLGTICGRCYQQNAYKNAKENNDIVEILKKLHMYCKFTNLGCSFRGSYTETLVHEEKCSYEEKICPFAYINRCNFKLKFAEISDHIKQEHPESVLNFLFSTVTISIDLKENNDLRLLSINGDNYILRFKSVDNLLCFIIYSLKSSENITFRIYHENDDFVTKSKDCVNLPDTRLGLNFDIDNSTTFDIDSLRKCFDTKVTTIIEIPTPSFDISNKRLLRFIECPVCNEYMTQQISQCGQGHSICKVCRGKLQECPLCKSTFGASRNFALESLTAEIYFPCKNFGCAQTILGESIEKHELDCKFKFYQCPFLIKLNCKWKGIHDDITEHLLREHSEYTEFHDFVKRKIVLDYTSHKYDTICLVLGENIFKVCVCINNTNKLFLTYGLYGPSNSAGKFCWETGIYHRNTERHKFVIKDVCSIYHTTNYKLDIEGYGVDNTIHFYHKVTPNY